MLLCYFWSKTEGKKDGDRPWREQGETWAGRGRRESSIKRASKRVGRGQGRAREESGKRAGREREEGGKRQQLWFCFAPCFCLVSPCFVPCFLPCF